MVQRKATNPTDKRPESDARSRKQMRVKEAPGGSQLHGENEESPHTQEHVITSGYQPSYQSSRMSAE